MLAAERQAKIAELIRVQGSVQVDDLAHDLKVSTMTIRRDLEKLQEDNILERCHGGAVAKQEVTYADKSTSHMQDKVRLAARCAPLVSAGDNIYLDAGTTTYEIAKAIQNVPDILSPVCLWLPSWWLFLVANWFPAGSLRHRSGR